MMRRLLQEKVVRTVLAYQMFLPGERVAVAVSGGPDSVAMLFLLHRLAARFSILLSVTHFNHRLRGEESDEEERFVKRLAGELGLECAASSGAVREFAKEKRMNEEAAARELRYRFFHELLESGKAAKIALGHTVNDQAETFLMRLLRGAGLRGLGAIHPVLEGRFVRPLIEVRRDEVLEFLRAESLPWREDSSNRDLRRTRNRIRHELLPGLQESYNPAIVAQLAHTAEQCRIDDQYLTKTARSIFEECLSAAIPKPLQTTSRHFARPVALSVNQMKELDPAIAVRVFRLAIEAVKKDLLRIDESHYEALHRLLNKGQSGDALDLPRGIRVERSFEYLLFHSAAEAEEDEEGDYELPLPLSGRVHLLFRGTVWQARLLDQKDWRAEFPRPAVFSSGRNQSLDAMNRDRACFDFSKLSLCMESNNSDTLLVRNVRPGDRYWPRGMAHSIKVVDLLSRQHLAAGSRMRWPLLAAGREVVWTPGCVESQTVAATPSSRQIVVVEELKAP